MFEVYSDTHHYVGYDEHGLKHVPMDCEAKCRPLFGVDQPISVTVCVVPLHVPITCIECAVRFALKPVWLNRKDTRAQTDEEKAFHQGFKDGANQARKLEKGRHRPR